MTNTPPTTPQSSLPALRPSVLATSQTLLDRRARVALAPALVPDPRTTVEEHRFGGVRCLSFAAPEASGTIIYLHGGGYRLGSPELFAPFAERLAHATGQRVIAVDYRLAPEHPFPAGLHDALDVYREIAQATGSAPALIGDSAGGGLAASLALACAQQQLPAPRAVVLLSGWVDLSCTAESYQSRADTDQLFSYADASEAAAQYLQGWPAADPFASPALADLTEFPPTLLFGSTDEAVLDDTLAMTRALARAGRPVQAELRPGLPHAWPTTDPGNAETAATLGTIAAFLAA
ncbi:acetyl esterase/lipase [Leucobacter exalbidus]|uniref:Acetyl esterase/lipase n=1 Tax=Leucobacter exalbidus TaxID=662960 RepID=A0A940T3N0_9MICO|nr:alpha/beta hydrolase fold domain-containing protein [Leucobacter exalbidus]MBP1325983.1 acetyl esterase/lipase [Leucobacter exalbidus]